MEVVLEARKEGWRSGVRGEGREKKGAEKRPSNWVRETSSSLFRFSESTKALTPMLVLGKAELGKAEHLR